MAPPDERTYQKWLGPLGKEPTVWTECFFADPVADIAVLGTPDKLPEESEAYDALVESDAPLRFADAPENSRAWHLSLDREWFTFAVQIVNDGPLLVREITQPIKHGMSGSPIISDEGKAIGVVCSATPEGDVLGSGLVSQNARPARDLPRRCLPE
jgi:hypothetical protein